MAKEAGFGVGVKGNIRVLVSPALEVIDQFGVERDKPVVSDDHGRQALRDSLSEKNKFKFHLERA